MDATTELQRYIARAYSEGKKKHADGTEACRWRCSNSYQRQPQTSYRSLQFMSWIMSRNIVTTYILEYKEYYFPCSYLLNRFNWYILLILQS